MPDRIAPAATPDRRPPVSVVAPFGGGAEEAGELLAALDALRLRPGDEVLVADNTPGHVMRGMGGGKAAVVEARAERSSYHARNVGAERARNGWLLFMDADCRPAPGLLDEYFSPPPAPGCGAVAGEVTQAADHDGLLARWASSRGVLTQAQSLAHRYMPAAVTANVLVRREAWEEVGGFHEGVRSGADTEFSWRLQEAGWAIEHRPRALVEHRHRERLGALCRQMAGHAAGAAWLNRRRPGSCRRPRPIRELARAAAGIAVWGVTARFERAAFKAIDGIVSVAQSVGYLQSNAAERAAAGPAELVVLVDSFPRRSETFVVGEIEALRRLGHRVRVESVSRPEHPMPGATRELDVRYLEDDPAARRLGSAAWLLVRHPVRCARDLLARRRWRGGGDLALPLGVLAPQARRLRLGAERHLHAHFATESALGALRLGRLCGLPYSLTAHAFDVYQRPRNLREKLERATFAVAVCEYTAANLRSLVSPEHREKIHTIVPGIDPERFRRRTPRPGGRTVVAIGRLVEKKGFATLIEAAALLHERASLDRVVIAGDGPLRDELASLIDRRDLGGAVELTRAWGAGAVLELLERADLFAMPCVVAADGDRDSLPVVVLEAMAAEVPVVASEEVGVPEVVRPEWGRLVPPGDPEALADAIEGLLALRPTERARMGAAGRSFVLEHAAATRQAARLAELIAAANRSGRATAS